MTFFKSFLTAFLAASSSSSASTSATQPTAWEVIAHHLKPLVLPQRAAFNRTALHNDLLRSSDPNKMGWLAFLYIFGIPRDRISAEAIAKDVAYDVTEEPKAKQYEMLEWSDDFWPRNIKIAVDILSKYSIGEDEELDGYCDMCQTMTAFLASVGYPDTVNRLYAVSELKEADFPPAKAHVRRVYFHMRNTTEDHKIASVPQMLNGQTLLARDAAHGDIPAVLYTYAQMAEEEFASMAFAYIWENGLMNPYSHLAGPNHGSSMLHREPRLVEVNDPVNTTACQQIHPVLLRLAKAAVDHESSAMPLPSLFSQIEPENEADTLEFAEYFFIFKLSEDSAKRKNVSQHQNVFVFIKMFQTI
jgi:hypothetical protein